MNLPAASQLMKIPIDHQTDDPTSFYNLVLSQIHSFFKPAIQEAAAQLPPFPACTESNEKYFYITTITRPPVEITRNMVVEKFQGSLKTFELVFKADQYKNNHLPPRKATKPKKRSTKSKYREELSTSDEELDQTSPEADLPARKKKKVQKKKPATESVEIDSDTDEDQFKTELPTFPLTTSPKRVQAGPSNQKSPSLSSRPVVAKTNLCYETRLSDQFMGSIICSPPPSQKTPMPAIDPSLSYVTSSGEMCILPVFHIIFPIQWY